MGRRELLIVVVFAVLGTAIYLAMAPPAGPGERSFSLSNFFRHVRTEIQRDAASSSTTLNRTRAVRPEVREVALAEVRGIVRLIGEDRTDVTAELKAEIWGPDMGEAEARARQVVLSIDELGETLRVRVQIPESRRQRLELTVRAPRRLRAHVGGARGQIDLRGMAEANVLAARQETRINDISGAVRVDHRDGPLEITNVGSLRVTARRDDLRIADVKGACTVDITDGRLETRGIGGEMQVEARRSNLELRSPTAPVRLTATDTRIDVRESRASVHIEGERSRTRIEVAAPAPISASNSDAPIEVRLPRSAGVTLEAVATNGTIRADDFGLSPTGDESERRLSSAIAGGGPLVTLRSRRGDIVVQALATESTRSTVDPR